ncbi:MAG: IPT/TIG domain-containing protein, partial [bacterium]
MDAGSMRKRLAVLAGGVCLFVLSSVFWAREAEADVDINYREPDRGTVGTQVEIRGQILNAGATVIIDFGNTLHITDTPSDADGTFTAIFYVDSQSYGTKVITARVSEALGENPDTTTFFILPDLYYCYPQSGPVGELVTIMGRGFGTQTGTVTIAFGTQQTIATGVPNQNGTFSITFFVSTQTFGTKVITAQEINNPSIISTTTFFLRSKIYYLFPTSGTFGTTITIMGNGFPGTETGTVTIHFGITQSITSTVINNVNGTFSITFNVDTQPGGSCVITATGLSPYGTPLATSVFVILPEIIRVFPTQGTVSSIVTVKGRG